MSSSSQWVKPLEVASRFNKSRKGRNGCQGVSQVPTSKG